MWAPQVFSKTPNSEDDYNSDFIFKKVKYWVYSDQLPVWINFSSRSAFKFPANTVIFFPFTKNKIDKLHPGFLFLDPILVSSFLPFMRCTQQYPAQLIHLTCPLFATVVQHPQQSFGQEANRVSLEILVSGRSSPLSSSCQCGEDPFSSFNVFIQEDSFKRKVLAQDQSKVITK